MRQEFRLVNRTGEALTTVVLRAYPNAFASEETSPAAAEDALYAACYPDGFSPGSLSATSAPSSSASQISPTGVSSRRMDRIAFPLPQV